MQPRAGAVVYVGHAASVQFTPPRSLWMRVIKVGDAVTADGFAWVDGYVLDADGEATERRSVFVRLAGLRRIQERRAA